MTPTVVDEFLLGEVGTGVDAHVGDRDFAVYPVGATDDGGFEHAVHGGQNGLDLLGIDVLPTADDHVLDPVHDGEIAVFVETADIAGVQPAVDDGLGGFLRPVQIAAHHRRSGDDDLTVLAGRQERTVGAHDPDLLSRQCGADGADLADPVHRIAGGGTGGLGESVAFDDLETESLVHAGQQFAGGRCGPADDEAQRGGVDVDGVGQGGEHGVDGGHGREVRRSQSSDLLEETARGELADYADLPATAQRSQDADHDRVDVEEGQDQQAVVGGGQFEVLRHRLGHGLRVTVVEHHAFGTSGGTARVDQQGEVLAVEFHGRPGLVPADGPHPIDVDGRPASGGGVRTEVDDERRFGVVDLICRLVLGESGI